MLVSRLGRSKYLERALDGEGARRAGGRWNHPGTALVYTSATLSLASIEYFVHVDPDDIPIDLSYVEVLVPDDASIERLDAKGLPRDWRAYPGPDSLRDLGTTWARSGRSLVLEVPSVVIPRERNFLLSPAHPDIERVTFTAPAPFSYDPRMFKGRHASTT